MSSRHGLNIEYYSRSKSQNSLVMTHESGNRLFGTIMRV